MDPRTAKMLAERRQAQATRPSTSASSSVAAWLLANWFRATVGIAVLMVAVSIGHYSMVTLPALKREQLAAQQRADQIRGLQYVHSQVGLERCLADADANYHAGWEKECRVRDLGPDCRLPASASETQDERRQNARSDCFKRYPSR